MKLVRWNPVRDLTGIEEEMNNIFDNFFGLPRRRVDFGRYGWTPRVNVEENDERYEVTAEVPGMEKEDINIDIRDHTLTLKGEKKLEEEKKDKDFRLLERCYGEFTRTFKLPEDVDTAKIEAAYKNGILMIDIPKTEKAKPKEIKVKVK